MDDLLIVILIVFVPMMSLFFLMVWNERKERRARQAKK